MQPTIPLLESIRQNRTRASKAIISDHFPQRNYYNIWLNSLRNLWKTSEWPGNKLRKIKTIYTALEQE